MVFYQKQAKAPCCASISDRVRTRDDGDHALVFIDDKFVGQYLSISSLSAETFQHSNLIQARRQLHN